jgi:hypothetical protein
MAPSQPIRSLPSSYINPNQAHNSPDTAAAGLHTQQAEFADLPSAYQAALNEWNSISHAHATIAAMLSNIPAFAPLSLDLYPQVPGTSSMTPFGPALRHRSYDISIIWSMLHLAQIVLLRSHPAMYVRPIKCVYYLGQFITSTILLALIILTLLQGTLIFLCSYETLPKYYFELAS